MSPAQVIPSACRRSPREHQWNCLLERGLIYGCRSGAGLGSAPRGVGRGGACQEQWLRAADCSPSSTWTKWPAPSPCGEGTGSRLYPLLCRGAQWAAARCRERAACQAVWEGFGSGVTVTPALHSPKAAQGPSAGPSLSQGVKMNLRPSATCFGQQAQGNSTMAPAPSSDCLGKYSARLLALLPPRCNEL